MWDLILNPFITVLTVLYQLFGSAVIAIILFTILIRLITYPLTTQQMRSSKAMQELQPELKKIQEKYKDKKDSKAREAMAQEQMALYRKAGINPLGGCLPLLIQLPIWIGLYQAINHALAATPLQLLDLSGRFMIGGLDQLVPLNNVWLGMDLTQPPTLNPTWALALPVLVLVTSYVQSKMITPPAQPTGDGQSNSAMAMTQSMTTMMPIMMGVFSLSFSVGLSIYFIVSNVMSIVQYSRNQNFQWRNLLPFTSPQTAPKPVIPKNASGKSTLKAKLEAERAAGISSVTVDADEPPPPKSPESRSTPPKNKSAKAKPAK
jgi:YidC/Oxa1 family membrane protein insertase